LAAGGVVLELFATADGLERHRDLVERADGAGIRVDAVSDKAAGTLSETVNPQGIVAVCRQIDQTWPGVLAKAPRLVAALVDTNDPGNAGTIVRAADAAGADAVVFAGGIDPYNGKVVRSSAGSLFHLDLVVGIDPLELVSTAAGQGLLTLATTAQAPRDLDELAADGALARPTLWLFGAEAQGLPQAVQDHADERVRVPMYGRAESLNLAVAAGICLFASAREQRRLGKPA
jgi:TrmH family RNA methyltransferase